MFAHKIAAAIATHVSLDEKIIQELIEIPPQVEMGDYAFPCFRLAKELKKSPVQIAQELAKNIQEEYIKEIRVQGPYINFFIKEASYAQTILENTPTHKEKNEKVMVEFSQPNTHKQFHIGHLRNATLGEALCRTLEYTGYEVIRATYPGDHGAHVAKSLWYLKNYVDKIPEENKGVFLGKIYVEATNKIKENPDLKEEVSKIHQALDAGDTELIELWKQTKEWSLDEFKAVYNELDIHFDVWYYESEEDKEANRIVDELLEANIAEHSQGAVIVDLEEQDLGVAVIRKSDGTTLYLTKDLSLGQKKFREYKLDKSIYLIDSRQKLHMQQAFAILQQMGFEKEMYHLPYEMVSLPGGAMSSREGNVILYEEFKQQVLEQVSKEVADRHEDWSKTKQEEVASAIMKAALKFGMLKVDNNTEIIFDQEQWLSLEGETGPYIQYTYARIQSIKKKISGGKADLSLLDTEEDKQLLRLLAKEQEVQEEAARNYKPHLIARYLLQLTKTLNAYYHKHHILSAQENLQQARMKLFEQVSETMRRNAHILAIPLLDEM